MSAIFKMQVSGFFLIFFLCLFCTLLKIYVYIYKSENPHLVYFRNVHIYEVSASLEVEPVPINRLNPYP